MSAGENREKWRGIGAIVKRKFFCFYFLAEYTKKLNFTAAFLIKTAKTGQNIMFQLSRPYGQGNFEDTTIADCIEPARRIPSSFPV